MPATMFSFSCAAWFAELSPEPAERELAGFRLRHLHEVLERLDRALLGNDDRVGRVVEPVDRRDVVGLVLHLAFERLQHDVRQVDADHVEAVAGKLVDLRPHEPAARARLVLHDRIDARDISSSAPPAGGAPRCRIRRRRESLPVEQVLFRAGLRQSVGRT